MTRPAGQIDKLSPQPVVTFLKYVALKGDAVPDSLDVAKQRKLVEDLKRDGQRTQDAESRLRDMLDFISSVRSYRSGPASKIDQKSRQKSMRSHCQMTGATDHSIR
jgi:hypothetical protein